MRWRVSMRSAPGGRERAREEEAGGVEVESVNEIRPWGQRKSEGRRSRWG